ncbi:MAG: TIGR03619 family F420-dependent LLM class oxidoreductase [Myxococcota bacterium]|nr:TIGR03619 family F420-dependent LLM class oxidoreductase [Myxococcales bacterium]
MTSPLPATPALSMHLGNFAATDPGVGGFQPLLDRARLLDECGIDRLIVSDHVVYGEDLEAYGNPAVGGIAGGRQPTDSDGLWLEPLTTLAVVAGVTKRARLQTGILIAALRRPVVLAKVASTLDVLSCGRLDLGVGVGWQREEYEAAGLGFEGRGRLLDHTLEVCQLLWREPRAAYAAPELAFEKIHMMPKPVQPGGVPIWVSGRLNKMVLRRIARFGSGWIPWGDDAIEPAKGLALVREALAEAGRDATGFQTTLTLRIHKDASKRVDVARTLEPVAALAAQGITDFQLTQLPVPGDEGAARDLLGEVVERFRKAVGR